MSSAFLLPLLVCGCMTLSQKNLESELVVGVQEDNTPFFTGTVKEPAGFEVDLARKLAARLGLTVRFAPMPAHKLPTAVDNGDVDIIMSGMPVTRENSQHVSFSRPYLKNGQIIVVRDQDATKYRPATAVKDSRGDLGVVRGSRGETYARAHCPNATIVETSSAQDLFLALSEGKCDVVIINAVSAKVLSDQFAGITPVFEPLTTVDVAWAVNSHAFTLLDSVNAAYADWTADGTLDEAINKWIPGYSDLGFDN